MITKEFAQHFTDEWINAWNSHDLDRILSHYSEDFTIETPMAVVLFPESKGIVKGKTEVRKYWQIGLDKIPDLKFELIDVLAGLNGITIYYVNKATNRRSAENLVFNNEKLVCSATVNYAG